MGHNMSGGSSGDDQPGDTRQCLPPERKNAIEETLTGIHVHLVHGPDGSHSTGIECTELTLMDISRLHSMAVTGHEFGAFPLTKERVDAMQKVKDLLLKAVK